jgi:hypothetical protein
MSTIKENDSTDFAHNAKNEKAPHVLQFAPLFII